MMRFDLRTLLISGLSLVAIAGHANEVELTLTREVEIKDKQVPYTLDVTLADVTPTRIGTHMLLDLSEAQSNLTERASGDMLLDICNAAIQVDGVQIDVDGPAVTVSSGADVVLYDCARGEILKAGRGAQVFAQSVEVRAGASVEVKDLCVYFHLTDLSVELAGAIEPTADLLAHLEKTQELILGATEAIFERKPICVDLPEALSSLAPQSVAGGTQEVGDGGLGVFLEGSVDVSTDTLIDLLQALQGKGVIPPAP